MKKTKVRSIVLFLLLLCVPLQYAIAQTIIEKGITMEFKDEPLPSIFKRLEKTTKYKVLFTYNDINSYRATGSVKDATIEHTLKVIIGNKPLKYNIDGQFINITINKVGNKIQGKVIDENGEPLIGVTIRCLQDNYGTTTDMDGIFSLSEKYNGEKLQISYIGKKPIQAKATSSKPMNITLVDDNAAIDEVVVTGIYTRKKDSFTGSEVTIQGEQLKELGASNILSSLSIFNPSLRITEDLESGSDPNHIPEMTLRGQSTFDLRGSAEGSRSNPNAPLYILDGVEVTAETIYDYDINRIENIVILKDASATAIYGSRGANGVIVMTTKRPVPGRIKVDFNANYTISTPDLSDYNLMNAAEKLEFERLAGVYIYSAGGFEGQMIQDKLYNSRLQEVARGVNTDWLSQPVQTSLTQKYSSTLEGGDNNLRYQLNLKYDNNIGVMKGSGRDNYGINAILDYNIGENFRVRNELSVSELTTKNSPFGSFSTYALQLVSLAPCRFIYIN